MNQKIAIPKDASAVILMNGDEVLWAQRNPKISFLGGWHAFAGGKVEAGDGEIEVENCNAEFKRFIVAATRELFEEVGVLIVRGGDKLTAGQRASLHDDLISGRSTFKEILDDWGLRIDGRDFRYAGFWTTPQFSPVRFKTYFFAAECPPKQKPYAAISELQNIEFIAPENALHRWENSEVLISPPVLLIIQTLAANTYENLENAFCTLAEKSETLGGVIDYIKLNPHITVFPLRTKTLPPATHTNCFVVGGKEFIVIDSASEETAEQEKLFLLIDKIAGDGGICREIIISHLHADHFGAETILQKHLKEKFGMQVPISAHKLTAESLRGKVEIQKYIKDEEIFNLKDEAGKDFELKALHTPGHARGHLCFYDKSKGFLLSSDNVLSYGSVIIAPPEGNMTEYLKSLERLKNLPNLRRLCGSHGTAFYDATARIEEYISHRLEREKQIVEAMENGAKTISEIVEKVYVNLASDLVGLAEKSVEAHLEKISAEGKLPQNSAEN